jgi:hypothetical protein
LEIGVTPDSGTIPLVAIFHDLVKKMKTAADDDKPIEVFTTANKSYQENKTLSSEEFNKAFKVVQVEAKSSKLMLGFKIKTKHSLFEIKQRLMQTYLIPHKLFLREHVGGFEEGVNVYTFGFLKNEHPDHPDVPKLQQQFEKLIGESWKKLDTDQRATWKEDLPQAFRGHRINFPINFSKERISAEVDGHPKVVTSALMVTTPRQYGGILRALMEVVIMGKKITNLIPLAFAREDETSYYHLVTAQERFMDQHRNIPILNVPQDASKYLGTTGETLEQVLYCNKYVQRVSHDPRQNRYHISTIAPKYKEVYEWIKKVLVDLKFPYRPSLRPLKSANGNANSVKYSTVLADVVSVAQDSYDASTIKTSRSSPWKQRPPMNISYTPTDEAFPPLPQKNNPTTATTTQSTTSETLDEDTIQSAISQAIRTLQDQHQKDLEKMKQDFEQKLQAIEKKVLAMGEQMVNQTYLALVHEDSPLATKADHLKLHHRVDNINLQLAQIIRMMSTAPPEANPQTEYRDTGVTSPPRTGKRPNQWSTPEKYSHDTKLGTQDTNMSSATSDLDEGMEGCDP